jgi:hypothetical protein
MTTPNGHSDSPAEHALDSPNEASIHESATKGAQRIGKRESAPRSPERPLVVSEEKIPLVSQPTLL